MHTYIIRQSSFHSLYIAARQFTDQQLKRKSNASISDVIRRTATRNKAGAKLLERLTNAAATTCTATIGRSLAYALHQQRGRRTCENSCNKARAPPHSLSIHKFEAAQRVISPRRTEPARLPRLHAAPASACNVRIRSAQSRLSLRRSVETSRKETYYFETPFGELYRYMHTRM